MMAKRDFHWLTPAVSSYFSGAVGQELLHQSASGNLGKMNPVATQAAFAGVLTLAGGLTEVFSRRENTGTRIAEGALASGLTLLGMSSVFEVDRMVAGKQPSWSKTAAGKALDAANSDYAADAQLPSSGSGDSAQDKTDSVSSSTDATDTYGSAADSGTTAAQIASDY